jgi:alpha-amylase/alpha-mannosidase (GH57 family)
MTNKAYFLLGIHNHQPVGNFPEVFERAYQDAYLPFMQAMERHPKLKWSLHVSGCLWDFIIAKHPEYVESVRKMIEAKRIELLSGGYYEPILCSIPDADKLAQIEKLNIFIKKTFGYVPSGLWLTERVWEPQLARAIRDANIKYTVIDDAHFAAAGMDVEKLRGYYITEENGSSLSIFPISQRLRYYMPFQVVSKTFEYIRQNSKDKEHPAFIMADDGEKFGLWPETNKHVYKDGWFESFLTELENNSSWLETMTFSEYLSRFGPEGRIYLPTASYFEMSEWTLPKDAQLSFERIVKEFEHRPDVLGFLKGGFWRNFLTKYPESNNMHKKMLYLSESAKRIRNDTQRGLALNFIYEAQCNCAYWHGVFGGLYLPHLRNAIYACLLSAHEIIKNAQKRSRLKIFDFDCDGNSEVLFEDKYQNIYIAPSVGGTIFEWDYMPAKVNFLNVLTRREEAYHKKLVDYLNKPHQQSDSVKTIHDIVKVKQKDLDQYLNFDWYRKLSLIDHFMHEGTKYNDFKKCKYGEQGDFVLGVYSVELSPHKITLSRTGKAWSDDRSFDIEVIKSIIPSENSLKIHYRVINHSGSSFKACFGPEFNFAFSFAIDNEFGEFRDRREWERSDKHSGFMIKFNIDTNADIWVYPIETVSLSESGFEKTYQGTCFTPVIRREIEAGGEIEFTFNFDISQIK